MAERLGSYRAKRDFEQTPEPRGRGRDQNEATGRFVVQEHHARRLHWDLRLEHDGALASWALPRGIPAHPAENRLAVRTEDHPLEYLEFEGEIPKGEYGAGTMTVWDRGTFEAEKFRDDEVIAVFDGERRDACDRRARRSGPQYAPSPHAVGRHRGGARRLRTYEGAQHRLELRAGLVPFRHRVGSGDDAGTRMQAGV